MSLLKKFIIVNVFLISGLLVYLSYLSINSEQDSKGSVKNEVLAASTENFGTFTSAPINQYPVISFNDSSSVPFQDRFATIRKYSSPAKFTNHLCNSINESSTAWKNDTLGCTGYVQNPVFVRLKFDNIDRLMLYNYYGLYSIDSSSNVVKWQSAHIDRFQSPTVASACGWTYDPSNIIPVKYGSKFYLYSKFNGVNNSNCLQFYDKYTAKPSLSASTNRLYLGYEVVDSGFLNFAGYTRTTVSPYISLYGGPFGPGPKNATYYSNSPISDIFGCVHYNNYICTKIQGIALQPQVITPPTEIKGSCTRWEYHDEWCQASSRGSKNSDGECVNFGKASCGRCGGAECCYGTQIPTGQLVGVCKSYTPSTFVGGSFKSSVNSPVFSTFQDFNFDPYSKVWSTTSIDVPTDYTLYTEEVTTNNAAHPINFTKDTNSSVFTTDNYMFKVAIISGKINVKRYTLNSNTYNLGGTSYINSYNYSLDIALSTYSKFSLSYVGADVYLMASGSTGFKFYRIANLNTLGQAVTSYDLYDLTSEITTKLPTGSKVLAFGIVDPGTGSKIYIATSNQIFYANILGTGGTVVPDIAYSNFIVNGNIYTKTDLGENFLYTNPSKKLEGNYITRAQTSSTNIKSINSVDFTFNFPSLTQLPQALTGFNVTTTFNTKFNLSVLNSTAVDPNPLASTSYVTFTPSSTNKFEIINLSQGKGIKIDLTNTNLASTTFKFDKYLFVNLDPTNKSRVTFYMDCSLATYSTICSGSQFIMKGGIFGPFSLQGQIPTTMSNTKFINITENPEIMLNLVPELRVKKYQMISKTKVNLKYSQ